MRALLLLGLGTILGAGLFAVVRAVLDDRLRQLERSRRLALKLADRADRRGKPGLAEEHLAHARRLAEEIERTRR